jgi:hypothetical protein
VVVFVQIVWKEWNVYSNYSLGSKEEEDKKIIHVRHQKTRLNVKRGHSRYYRSGRLAKERKKGTCHTPFLLCGNMFKIQFVIEESPFWMLGQFIAICFLPLWHI